MENYDDYVKRKHDPGAVFPLKPGMSLKDFATEELLLEGAKSVSGGSWFIDPAMFNPPEPKPAWYKRIFHWYKRIFRWVRSLGIFRFRFK